MKRFYIQAPLYLLTTWEHYICSIFPLSKNAHRPSLTKSGSILLRSNEAANQDHQSIQQLSQIEDHRKGVHGSNNVPLQVLMTGYTFTKKQSKIQSNDACG